MPCAARRAEPGRDEPLTTARATLRRRSTRTRAVQSPSPSSCPRDCREPGAPGADVDDRRHGRRPVRGATRRRSPHSLKPTPFGSRSMGMVHPPTAPQTAQGQGRRLEALPVAEPPRPADLRAGGLVPIRGAVRRAARVGIEAHRDRDLAFGSPGRSAGPCALSRAPIECPCASPTPPETRGPRPTARSARPDRIRRRSGPTVRPS